MFLQGREEGCRCHRVQGGSGCFLLYLSHCVHFPVAFVWDAHCSLREVSFWVVGLDLHTICWPLLCVCVTLASGESSIFNWIVWFCFPSLIIVE